MSDQDPNDPTRIERPVGGQPPRPAAEDPTSVLHQPAPARETVRETTTTRRDPVGPPPADGVSAGLAIALAIAADLLGLLAGYLLFGEDDDDTATAPVEDVEPGDTAALEELVTERDELAQQAEDQQAQIDDLQSQLDEVTAERDELAEGADDGGDEVVTVPAPDLVGSTLDDAGQVASENGWTVVQREVAEEGEEGEVVAQYPDPGTPMIEGSVLVLDVPAPAQE